MPATQAKHRFQPEIIFLRIKQANNIITWRRRQCADPGLQCRSSRTLHLRRSRSPPKNRRSREKLFPCDAVASTSPGPPGTRSRRGATLLRQTLVPPPSIDDEQILDLRGLNLLQDGPLLLWRPARRPSKKGTGAMSGGSGSGGTLYTWEAKQPESPCRRNSQATPYYVCSDGVIQGC
jgi:hypothetical protein